MIWEIERIQSYLHDLEREVIRLRENANAIRYDELRVKVEDLETENKRLNDEIRRLKLRNAELGLDLGRALNEK